MIGKLEKQNKHLSSTQNYISYLSFSVSIFSVNYWINSVFWGEGSLINIQLTEKDPFLVELVTTYR